MRKVVTLFAGAVLLVAVALQGLPYFSTESAQSRVPLSGIVPAAIEGWRVRDEPLGPTEATVRHVEKMLGFDEYVYRSYASGSVDFSIYVARWSRGRAAWQDVAQHTPDVCWVNSGWTCRQRKTEAVLRVGGKELLPGQWREFLPPRGPAVQVMFWHVLGERVIEHERTERFAGVREALRHVFDGSGEQYFIRIASTSPLEELAVNPGFERAVAGLGGRVLWRDRSRHMAGR